MVCGLRELCAEEMGVVVCDIGMRRKRDGVAVLEKEREWLTVLEAV